HHFSSTSLLAWCSLRFAPKGGRISGMTARCRISTLCGWATALALVSGCGDKPTFSPAAISVDPSKRMSDLTSDERTSVCNEFARALTASFGPREVGCRYKSETKAGTPTCQANYDSCLGSGPPLVPVTYCHQNMADMWTCPITIGQYQACFNDLNREFFDLIENTAVCSAPTVQGHSPASCQAAPCDYLWQD